ncbi:hypothetical protein A5860_002729, partial [Enterococcus faecium]
SIVVRSFYFINSLVTICKIQLHITINFRIQIYLSIYKYN